MKNQPLPLDDLYVRKHARPGEDWEPARRRLEGEVATRHTRIPDCPICTQHETSMEMAEYEHSRGLCLPDAWSAEALEQKKLDKQLHYRQTHIEAMATIARRNVQGRFACINSQVHSINALIETRALHGFLDACEALGVFQKNELLDMRLIAHQEEEKHRWAFMEKYKAGEADAIPWRISAPVTKIPNERMP